MANPALSQDPVWYDRKVARLERRVETLATRLHWTAFALGVLALADIIWVVAT